MIEPKNMVSIVLSLRGDVWLVWNFFSAATLALLGWVVSHRADFDLASRRITAIGYSVFFATIALSFVKICFELDLAIHDLNSVLEQRVYTLPKAGFLEDLSLKNYWSHLAYALASTGTIYGCLLLLLLKDPWKLFGRHA